MTTPQEDFWTSQFGKDYSDRNAYSTPSELDAFYETTYGISRSSMNSECLNGLSLGPVLEVGCNIGNQLNLLQSQGKGPLYGIEIQEYAAQKARELSKHINIIQGSGFDIPFKDVFFDLVFTSGVLIHVSPDDIRAFMSEIYRVSKKYIWGFEYFSSQHTAIEYRGNQDRLWKGDFSALYREFFPNLRLVKEKRYGYLNSENVDSMFLLEKT
ncbi:MAG: methyltransferase domain-containing protein [Candidatus Magasanikbacteria bacterium]|nr:methyltransferase domain-containing protein [Candidatus Magasanikbacteria bacterium]